MTNETQPASQSLILSMPIIGWFIRSVLGTTMGRIYLLTALAVVLWAVAIVIWGVPGLFIPAVIATPTMLFILVLISRG